MAFAAFTTGGTFSLRGVGGGLAVARLEPPAFAGAKAVVEPCAPAVPPCAGRDPD